MRIVLKVSSNNEYCEGDVNSPSWISPLNLLR
jgi:hypothetical protein